jgi:hypothetical protein
MFRKKFKNIVLIRFNACVLIGFINNSTPDPHDKFLWMKRYKNAKDKSQRMVVIPRYEPVFVEPNHKEYETQVKIKSKVYCILYSKEAKSLCNTGISQ